MLHRRLIAMFCSAFSLGLAGTAAASWSVMFIPDEATGVTIAIDGEHVLDWKSTEGQTLKDVPAKWANLQKIRVRADASPNGKKAHVKVFWNEKEACDLHFDDGEECDASR